MDPPIASSVVIHNAHINADGKTNINDIWNTDEKKNMGPFNYGHNPNKNDVIAFLNTTSKNTQTAWVINDIVVGDEHGTSPNFTRPITVKPNCAEFEGSFDVTYTINDKANLNTIITTKNITTPYDKDYDFVDKAANPDNVNKKYILQSFIDANSSANLNINQLDISSLDYSSDAVLKSCVGTATIVPTSWSSLYTGSANVTFSFKPRLEKVLTVGDVEQGYNINDQRQIEANLVQSCFDKNSERIRDFEFCKANIFIYDYTSFSDVTFEGSSAYYIGDKVKLKIFKTYEPTPEDIFSYSADNTTITGFRDDSVDLSAYNVLNFPNKHNGVTITTISKAFSPTDATNTGTSYQSLKAGGSLNYLHLPANLTAVYGFGHCDSFTGNIYIPGTTKVNNNAFEYCANITSVTLNSPSTSWGSRAFSCCNNLKSISFPDSALTCAWFLAAYCQNLNSIYVPDSVTFLDGACFKQCGRNIRQKELYLGKSINSIADAAFRGCGNFKTLYTNWNTLPTVVTTANADGSFSNGTNFDFIHNDGTVPAVDIITLLKNAGLSGTPVIIP